MKLNKGVIFVGLKIGEILGVVVAGYIFHLIGKLILYNGFKQQTPIFLGETIWCGVAISGIVVMILYFLWEIGSDIVKKNMEWAGKIQEWLKRN